MKKFKKSVIDASRGVSFLIKSQRSAHIELIITAFVIISAFVLNIDKIEWLIILICIALVLGLEAINTAIEVFADKMHPGHNEEIGKVKDIAAGAVLIAAIFAAIIGIIIFVPRLLELL